MIFLPLRLCAIALLSVLPATLLAQGTPGRVLRQGMTEAELLAFRGSPESKASIGTKSIYRFRDVQVTLVNGKVTLWTWRDRAAEQADAESRRQRIDAERRSEVLVETNPAQTLRSPPLVKPPVYYPVPQTSRYFKTKEEQIARINLELERWRAVKDRSFHELSKPTSQRSISAAERDLADAKITELEGQLAAAEALPN